MTATGPSRRLLPIPSIGTRLANALTIWSVVWGLAVGAAVWLVASEEVDELLDDALASSASLVAALVQAQGGVSPDVGNGSNGGGHFAWQLVGPGGQLLQRSALAPDRAWHRAARPGYSDVGATGRGSGWRLYGLAVGHEGRVLYVAQARAERHEAQREVVISAVLAALAVGLLGQVWLRARASAALRPLQTLSNRVAAWDLEPARVDDVLGQVTRRELQPLHDALHALALRLQTRLANEQAFAAHAAHALRTPLAAIDAQLAVALRQAPPELQERLRRVREAAARLQAVVTALLGLFRSGDEIHRGPVPVQTLIDRLPPGTLVLRAEGDRALDADLDLLLAAVINLLDNARRHGAREVVLRATAAGALRVEDDGQGLADAQRAALQSALDRQAYDLTGEADGSGSGPRVRLGLGLMLADRVARAHGGRLQLLPADRGFALQMTLGPPAGHEDRG